MSNPTFSVPYRSAIIGVGKAGTGTWAKGGGHQIGYAHAGVLKSNPRTELVAAADINADNLSYFLTKFDLPATAGYSDYRVMLAEVKPDIVSICTYVGLHADMIEACANAGVKGILCEKPFVHSIPALERVKAVTKRTGLKLTIAHIRRYLPVFNEVRTLMHDGTIGRPIHIYAGIGDWDLSEWGSHWLDIFRFMNHDQPVRWVFGQGRVRSLRGYSHAMEEHAVVHFELANGCRGTLDGGKGFEVFPRDEKMPGVTMTIVGTNGIIQIRQWLSEIRVINASGERIVTVPNESHELTWPLYLGDLVSWMDGGPEAVTGLSHTAESSELNLAAYLSMVRGDRVDFPVEDGVDEWPVEALARRNTK